MAIIKCPECGQDVSDSAMKCPHCGKQLRKPKRSIMGKIFLWLFYIFNALMLLWLIAGITAVPDTQQMDEFEKAGTAIGTGIGVMAIFTIWVIGDIITGLLALMTRPK